MRLTPWIAAAVIAGGLAGGAQAETPKDLIIKRLVADGFTRMEVSRTFLGRIRIVATRPGAEREIVFNPTNGLILRDYLELDDAGDDDEDEDNGSSQAQVSSGSGSGGGSSSNSGSGSGGDDEPDDDDSDDDDSDDSDEDDNDDDSDDDDNDDDGDDDDDK
ncbi:hypothetical protein [Pseudaestuariivita atlantica]|nr:hypothetical protein [Pseudaestuariivita atlantica]